MVRSIRVYEATRNANGDFECYSIPEELDDGNTAPFVKTEFAEQFVDTEAQNQPFYISPNIAQSVAPDWALQANALFLQGLHSNVRDGQAAYLRQMQEQFELMRQTLQQQLAQYSQRT